VPIEAQSRELGLCCASSQYGHFLHLRYTLQMRFPRGFFIVFFYRTGSFPRELRQYSCGVGILSVSAIDIKRAEGEFEGPGNPPPNTFHSPPLLIFLRTLECARTPPDFPSFLFAPHTSVGHRTSRLTFPLDISGICACPLS